jgi:hypothetical protein
MLECEYEIRRKSSVFNTRCRIAGATLSRPVLSQAASLQNDCVKTGLNFFPP